MLRTLVPQVRHIRRRASPVENDWVAVVYSHLLKDERRLKFIGKNVDTTRAPFTLPLAFSL